MRDDERNAEGWAYGHDEELDAAFDEELAERLRAALDAVGPSGEAQDRMLANLLAAQEAREAAPVPDDGFLQDHNNDIGRVDEAVSSQHEVLTVLKGRRRKAGGRAIGMAVAASLLLAVIGVGVGSRILGGSNQAADHAQAAAPAESFAEGKAKAEEESVAASTDLAAEADSAEITSGESAAGGAIAYPEEYESFAPSGGAFDVSSDPSYDLAVGYPEIRLRSGEVLMIEEHLGEPVIIGDEWVEGFKGDADAFSEDGRDSVRCWVYLLPVSDDGLYVVRYAQDGSCYAARVVE